MGRPKHITPQYRVVSLPGRATLYASWTENGRTKVASLKTTDEAQARRIVADWQACSPLLGSPRRLLQQRLASAKARAAKIGVPFALTFPDLDALWRASGGRCAVSGLLMDTGRRGHHPMRASLDRIDSSKGYEIGNVRLVCVAVNYALADWGEDFLFRLASGIIRTTRSAGSEIADSTTAGADYAEHTVALQ